MTVDAQTREEPKQTLQTMEVHDSWAGHYRSPENEPFYELAFDFIAKELGRVDGQVIDAGCGSATKTLHLVKRGYRVLGLDFAESILVEARAAAARAGVASQVEFKRADLTQIDLESNSVRAIVCWGVMMHIPAVDKAVAELSRVLAPGGTLIVSEGNKRSLQGAGLRWLKRALGRERAEVLHTPAGIEFWEESGSGRLMTRQADIPWMIREFEKNGLTLTRRHAGQFSEIFTLLPWKPLRTLVHVFNGFWFRVVGCGGPAFGNLLVFRKKG